MATLTINFTNAVQARIKAAMKLAWELDRPATLDDLKDLVIRDIKKFVTAVERQKGRAAVDEALTDITLT